MLNELSVRSLVYVHSCSRKWQFIFRTATPEKETKPCAPAETLEVADSFHFCTQPGFTCRTDVMMFAHGWQRPWACSTNNLGKSSKSSNLSLAQRGIISRLLIIDYSVLPCFACLMMRPTSTWQHDGHVIQQKTWKTSEVTWTLLSCQIANMCHAKLNSLGGKLIILSYNLCIWIVCISYGYITCNIYIYISYASLAIDGHRTRQGTAESA